MKEHGAQQRVLIVLTAFGVISIFPFAVLRFIQGDFAVGAMDLILSLMLLAVCAHVIFTGKVRVSGFLVATCSSIVAVSTIYLRGADQAYWTYPAILAIYYLIPSRAALVMAVAVSLSVILLIWRTHDAVGISTIVATVFISNIFAYVFSRSTEQKQILLESEATTDELTRTGNRRALKDRLHEIVLAQGRVPTPVSLLLLDLDHFKEINDRFGHRIGDLVLVKVARAVGERIRVTDMIYRYGGEEFVIVAPGIEGPAALGLAEELRELIAELTVADGASISASFGVAQYQDGETYNHWLDRADKALYKAKNDGRDRCVMAN